MQIKTAGETAEISPEQVETTDIAVEEERSGSQATILYPKVHPQSKPEEILAPQDCGCGGGGNKGSLGYIFAIGRIYPAFPSQSIQEEFNYAYQEFKAEGPPNALFYQVLSQGQNLYIAQEMCWIVQIQGVDTYIAKPRSDVELYELIASLAPVNAGELKFNVIIGPRGPVASPEMCNGLQLPTVICNLSYDFTFSQFVNNMVAAIPNIPQNVVENMLQQMLQITDNAGETDVHRAINYLTIRSTDIYYMAWQMQNPNPPAPYPPGIYFLQGISSRPANVQGNRVIVDVIFEYMARDTYEIAYWYVKVDVTGEFPFLASKQIARYYPAP